ncbi:hypothetical protein AMAG_01558 [Allomyces macrogynus ATCC 38327]|uniref:Uncharacterized protein n=1 Tax=Allomyces macrogynus (strain ATCC 38327) TaxID=578462 RepID=A0A0L0RZV3_ALLM3|nr:hypothetical protein AMAG_01558 [Allomyces macrogynus ATCC 38327]|eukprot:KNE55670.1 hypothetical protein AMAG_01558 [Allomyces macrogynus ATCC 38327]
MAHSMRSTLSVAIRTLPPPRLEYMPEVVINRVIELLLFRTTLERQLDEQHGKRSLPYETGRLAVLYLALAAPNLYAPCLHAIIRTTTRHDAVNLLCRSGRNATIPLDLVGKLVCAFPIPLVMLRATMRALPNVVWDAMSSVNILRPIPWSLVLPPRAQDRSYIGPSALAVLHAKLQRERRVPLVSGWGTDAFLPWTLLPVSIEQRRYCPLGEQDRAAPSYYYERVVAMSLNGVLFPAGLAQLDLWKVVLPPAADIPPIFQQLCNLRSLVLTDVTSPPDDGAAFLVLAAHIPTTVTTLELLQMRAMLTDMNVRALAGRIQHALTGFKSLTVHQCQLGLLARMVAVLPRTGMHKLDIEGLIKDEHDFVQCSTLLADMWPSSVRVLRLSIMLDGQDHGPLRAHHAMPVLLARLTLATRSLFVSTNALRWTLGACQQLPLASTLTELWLSAGFQGDAKGIEHWMTRLPESLMHLSLRAWVIGRTPSAAVIGAKLPPNLITLRLTKCHLTDDDLAGFVWPKSLLHLNLKGNYLTKVPAATLPAQLQTLGLQDISDLLDDNAAAWAAVLPTTLRALNIAGTPLGDNFAAALLQRMPAPRVTAAPRLVYVDDTVLSREGKEQLTTKFTVIDTRVPF